MSDHQGHHSHSHPVVTRAGSQPSVPDFLRTKSLNTKADSTNNQISSFDDSIYVKKAERDELEGRGALKLWSLFGVSVLLIIGLFWMGSKVFVLPIWLPLITSILYTTITAILFTLSPNKSILTYYTMVISIGILAFGFISNIVWIIVLVITLLAVFILFLSYKDIERAQLLSRLFDIHGITKGGISFLEILVIAVLSMGFFSQVQAQGVGELAAETILGNDTISNQLIFDPSSRLRAGTATFIGVLPWDEFVPRSIELDAPTIKDFILQNDWRGNLDTALTVNERTQIEDLYKFDTVKKKEAKQQSLEKKYEELYTTKYNSAVPNIKTVLTQKTYLLASQKYLSSRISTSFNSTNLSDAGVPNLIPDKAILPIFVTVIFILFLLFIKQIIHFFEFIFLTFTGTSVITIVWLLLTLTGFARIKVEYVEAEIVSL
jgi:hypothetical protein